MSKRKSHATAFNAKVSLLALSDEKTIADRSGWAYRPSRFEKAYIDFLFIATWYGTLGMHALTSGIPGRIPILRAGHPSAKATPEGRHGQGRTRENPERRKFLAPNVQTGAAYDRFLTILGETLKKGDPAAISGFGSFKVMERKRERVAIPARVRKSGFRQANPESP
jgi:hypothetical protein